MVLSAEHLSAREQCKVYHSTIQLIAFTFMQCGGLPWYSFVTLIRKCHLSFVHEATKTRRSGAPLSPSFALFPSARLFLHIMARDLAYTYSSQPNSSQSNGNEASIDRAFWQSTPTALEQLREVTDVACHPARAFFCRVSSQSYRRVLTV